MRYVAPPAIILRRGLMAGAVYPHLARHLGSFLAATLFGTSALALDATTYRCGPA
jgi:5-methylthioribose kinase